MDWQKCQSNDQQLRHKPYLENSLQLLNYLFSLNLEKNSVKVSKNGEKIKIKGYLEDFALSKNEADDLIMSAREIVYQDWEMKNGKEKIKVVNFWNFKEGN